MVAVARKMRGDSVAKMDIPAEVVERKDAPGAWGVEAIDHGRDGSIYMAIFSGPDARDRAVEYAALKFSRVELGG
jgi:hypothetical protein